MGQCTNVQDAANRCAAEGAFLAAPQDCPTAVQLSYLANQADIHIAKTDATVEGTWQVGYGMENLTRVLFFIFFQYNY